MFNKKKRNPWQHISIILKGKLADVNLIMMPPLLEFFIKGLKNAHTLATKVYEKGPQSLADAIREVEKLQAAQQLTSTLLPPSSVNIMSSDEDKCFQCHETGHMAHYCPHIRCFDCNDYGHVTADCPNKIPPSGIHLGVTIMIGITTMTIKIGTGSADLNLTLKILDIGVTVAVTLAEITLDPFTDPHTSPHHATEAWAHPITNGTHHTADPHHAGVSPEITVDPWHVHPTNTITKHQQDHLPALIKHPGKPRTGNTSKSPLMTHPPNTIALMNRTATQRMIYSRRTLS